MKKSEIRQKRVLKNLIEDFIRNIEPVSSKLICEKYIHSSSPATIRIDLNKLEKSEYVYQPYTSAGRIPTIKGYRSYLGSIKDELLSLEYKKKGYLRDILIKYYKNIPTALHYIMQLLAKETDQLSFVAEPEVSSGFLKKLEVFRISGDKLLFVVSLDSGLDKTVIINCKNNITDNQLKAIVRYMNEEFIGSRMFDIQERHIAELSDKITEENRLLKEFLAELHNAFSEISSYFIHYDGSINFLEQPEFNEKTAILKFLGYIQRHDHIINIMRKNYDDQGYKVLMGEELEIEEMKDYALIFSRYEIFGIPGYLGIIGPTRMDYKYYIPIIRDISETITNTTKKGMVVLINDKEIS